MEKVIVKRTYTKYASIDLIQKNATYVRYVGAPITATGYEPQAITIDKAYAFDMSDPRITTKHYGNHTVSGDNNDGDYEYNEELIPYIVTAKDYAIDCHRSTNHSYDGNRPYEVHLQMVFDTAVKFSHLIPADDRQDVFDACWCHDVIEDCRQTYNDVKKATNERVAELVYALTNEKGKNRAERGNEKYYQGIRNVKHADFVKLCDRIANYQYSKENGSRMCGMYEKEQDKFASHFALNGVNDVLIEHLYKLMGR